MRRSENPVARMVNYTKGSCLQSFMMTASVLAKRTQVPLFTVRNYTRIGLLKPVRDLRNGYKIYRRSDEDRLRFIAAAKELGFTLSEIEEILDHAAHDESPCPMVREIVEKRVKENKEKIRELKRLQVRLESAAKMWSTMKDAEPDGHSVCRLIETFAEAKDRI
jgi:DNA-binding transcriptional MerR regulator